MRIEAIAWFDMPNNGKWHGQSVMPQQELIRCKDCIYKQGRECTRFADIPVYDEDYCSKGERNDRDKKR